MSATGLDLETLQTRLAHVPVTGIRYYDVTGSTNDDALAWIDEGAENGCLIVADVQTAGRGRLDHTWITRSASALAFSLIFKTQQTVGLPLFAPLGALGVCMALENLSGINPQIKWPNDVLVNRKKVCGILTEASWQGDGLVGVVLGIGINVASSAVRLDDDFRFPADSLQNSLGKQIDRMDLLVEIIRLVFLWQQKMGSGEFIQEWNRRLAFRGERVQINRPGKDILTGNVVQVSQDGLLLIRQENGEEVPVSAGDVGIESIYLKPEK